MKSLDSVLNSNEAIDFLRTKFKKFNWDFCTDKYWSFAPEIRVEQRWWTHIMRAQSGTHKKILGTGI